MMTMAEGLEFLSAYRFSVTVDGETVGVAKVSEIDVVIKANGKKYAKPVDVMFAPKKGLRSLSEVMGETPWQRRTVVLTDLDRDGKPSRRVTLKRCRFRGYKQCARDAMSDGVLVETVKLHPSSVSICTPRQ